MFSPGNWPLYWWLGLQLHFIAERVLLGAVIGPITWAMQWLVLCRSDPLGIWWLGVSIPGYLLALLGHGLLIFQVGGPLVRSLTGISGSVMNTLSLAVLPFGLGLVAAVIDWSLLQRRLDNALVWVSIALVGFWAWWVLLQTGTGAKDMGTGLAVALMASLIGVLVRITTGGCLVWLTRGSQSEVEAGVGYTSG